MSDFGISNVSLLQRIESLSQEAAGKIQDKDVNPIGSSFKDYFANALHSVNDQQKVSHTLQTEYTMGEPNVSLSQVMVQMQKAQVSLAALVAVRDKILEGYKSILNTSL